MPRATARITARTAGWTLAGVALAGGAGLLAAESPSALMVVAIAGVAAAAALRRPLESLLVLLVIRAAAPDSVILDTATLLGGGVALLLSAPRLPARRATLPLLAFLLIALPSVPLHPSPDEGAKPDGLYLPIVHVRYLAMPSDELLNWARLAEVLVLLGLAGWTVGDRRRLRLATGALLASAAVPIAIALEQLATGKLATRGGFRSVEGPFSHPNYFAFYLLVVLTVALVVLLERPDVRVAVPVGVLLALGGVCLLLTYTRAAWVGFAVALMVLGLLGYPRLLLVGVVALALGAFAFPSTVHKVRERFGDLTSRNESASKNSWQWRRGQWQRMLPYGSERPLTGQGFGSYPRVTLREFGTTDPDYQTVDSASPVTSPRGFTAHNDYVRSYVELGAPGVVLWAAFLLGMLSAAAAARRLRGSRAAATASVAVTVALIGISASDNVQGYTVVLDYAAVLCGAASGVALRERALARAEEGALRRVPAGAAAARVA